MMLEWLGETRESGAARDAAAAIERAVDRAFASAGLRTHDIGRSSGTREVAETVAGLVTSGDADPG